MKKTRNMVILLAVAVLLIFAFGFNRIISSDNTMPDTTPAYLYTGVNAAPADTASHVFDFSKDLQGWGTPDLAATTDQAFSSASLNTTTGHEGHGCAQVDANFDSTGNSLHAKGDFVYNVKLPMDLSRSVITAWVFVPPEIANASSYSAAIFIKDASNNYSAGGNRELYMFGWTQVSCPVSGMTGKADGKQVNEVGIQVYREIGTDDMMKDVSGVQFMFDNISF